MIWASLNGTGTFFACNARSLVSNLLQRKPTVFNTILVIWGTSENDRLFWSWEWCVPPWAWWCRTSGSEESWLCECRRSARDRCLGTPFRSPCLHRERIGDKIERRSRLAELIVLGMNAEKAPFGAEQCIWKINELEASTKTVTLTAPLKYCCNILVYSPGRASSLLLALMQSS